MKELRNGSTSQDVKPGATKRIDLSNCKLVAPYGQDPHDTESLSTLATKLGKPGLRSIHKA